jgi:Ca2+-binding RTX toxin-like protein
MKFKAGKGFGEKVYVEDFNGDLVSLAEFLDGAKLLSVTSYSRVAVTDFELHYLYGKDEDGAFSALDNKDDFKFDLAGSKIKLSGELGSGDDFVRTGSSGGTIDLGDGRNVFRGGDGKDFVQGGSQADTIHCGGGNDVIRGGGGSDVLSGGKGSDYFSFEHFDSFGTRITDFKVGEDMLELNGWSMYDLKIKDTRDGVLIRHVGDDDRILLEGVLKKDLADFEDWLI